MDYFKNMSDKLLYLDALSHTARVHIYSVIENAPKLLKSIETDLEEMGYTKGETEYHLKKLKNAKIIELKNDNVELSELSLIVMLTKPNSETLF